MAGRDPEWMVSAEDIAQSLRTLLSTPLDARGYGCELGSMTFVQVDLTMMSRVEDVIRRTILNWEPRITVDRILLEAHSTERRVVRIQVEYTIRVTRTRGNFVYLVLLHVQG
jgi:phage baseplate assembly protein W